MTETPVPPVMAKEAAEAPAVLRRQIERCAAGFAALGERLRRAPPRFVVTCARGSSDHATAYGKYLIETVLGRAVASVGPSIASVYDSNLDLRDSLFVVVSQSGRSPDLIRLTETAKAGGALVVGLINDETSPLFSQCDVALPLCAGQETSVAATKSYIASCFALLQLAAHWSQDAALRAAVPHAADALDVAQARSWWPALKAFEKAGSLYVIGRGLGLGPAAEMALKFKETCRLHAEAFSAAEVMHGPLALVRPGFPILALGQDDESARGTREAVARLVAMEATILTTLDVPGAVHLPTVPDVDPVLAPLCQIQSFYGAAWQLARLRGLDPDAPIHLRKVTETV